VKKEARVPKDARGLQKRGVWVYTLLVRVKIPSKCASVLTACQVATSLERDGVPSTGIYEAPRSKKHPGFLNR